MQATVEGQRLAEFLNTEDHRRPDRREQSHAADDELTSPASLTAWMRAHAILSVPEATDADLRRARRLRAALRDVVAATGSRTPIEALRAEARSLPLVLDLDGQGVPRLAPAHPGMRGALTGLLIDAIRLAEMGQWDRLKRCAADDCRWVFFDRSRPGTGRWCAHAACGNREKTRRYRRRRAKARGGASQKVT